MGNTTTTHTANVGSVKSIQPNFTLKTRIKIHLIVGGVYSLILAIIILAGGFYG
jgi:hypothetical protein